MLHPIIENGVAGCPFHIQKTQCPVYETILTISSPKTIFTKKVFSPFFGHYQLLFL